MTDERITQLERDVAALQRMMGELKQGGAGINVLPGLVQVNTNLVVRGALTANQIGCRLLRTGVLTVAHNTSTPIPYTDAVYDFGNCWAVGDPARIYAPVKGVYLMAASFNFNTGSVATSYNASIAFLKNATLNLMSDRKQNVLNTAINQQVSVAGSAQLAAGDYLEVHAFQGSGTDKTVAGVGANADYWNWVSLTLLFRT